MKIIELYILKRVVILFLTVLLSAVAVTWTVQVLGRINFLTTSGQSFLTVLKFSSLFIPSAIPLAMPFAFVIAVAQTLSTMNQDSELIVINACGAPRSSIWRPIMLLALALAMSSFFVANYVVPQARITMRNMVASAHSDLINTFIQEGAFRELTNNIYMEIGERRPDSTIGHLFIADQRDPKFDLYYYAVESTIASNTRGTFLIMNNGEILRRANETNNISIIKFDSYTFDLGEFSPANKGVELYPKDQTLSYLFSPDPNSTHYQRRPTQYIAELHKRLTEWLYPIVFALVALVVAGDARSHREARISALFSAISLSLFIYWLGYFFNDRAEKDLAYIPLLYFIPIGSIAYMSFLVLNKRQFVLPSLLFDFIAAKLKRRIRYFKRQKRRKGRL